MKRTRPPTMMKRVEDATVRAFLNSGYAKRKFGTFLRFGSAILVRSLLTIVISEILSTRVWFLDYILQIFLTIVMFLMTDVIYSGLLEFQEDFDSIAKYAIDNYSEDNLRRWKRYAVMGLCAYFVVLCSVFDMNSRNALVYSMQFMLCYAITDEIENPNGPLHTIYERVYDSIYSRLRTKGFEDDIMIIPDYDAPSRARAGPLDPAPSRARARGEGHDPPLEEYSRARGRGIEPFKPVSSGPVTPLRTRTPHVTGYPSARFTNKEPDSKGRTSALPNVVTLEKNETILACDEDFIFSDLKVKKE